MRTIERRMEQGIKRVAKNMLRARKSIEEIMEMTGLSREHIQNLQP